jgi:hypothetical protein
VVPVGTRYKELIFLYYGIIRNSFQKYNIK